jgi:N-methylhydantoinase A/oxoprolinase/acetone carboxylase beta subunit
LKYRLGIDVGGTNTDAVIIDNNLNLIAKVKVPTTADVSSGIYEAMHYVLEESGVERDKIKYAMLGTTHCTNAIVERKRLNRVGIIRLGKPATEAIKPMTGWPEDLVEKIGRQYFLTGGGHEFDGRPISTFNENDVRKIVQDLKGKVDSVAIISVFSPVSSEYEERTAEIIREALGDFPVSLSHQIGSIGLLERENATILNAALVEVAKTTAEGFITALERENVKNAEVYLCQNDGTLMSAEYAMKYPILTIACGPTNSIRGASFLAKSKDAIVLDVGGTTSDIGVVSNGFPRESAVAVEIGGVRTNFRMPDLISIGLGGGTIIREENGEIKIGPDSVGYKITKEALVFGGNTLTTTDLAVRLGMCDIGDKSKVQHIEIEFAQKCFEKIKSMVEEAIEKIKLSSEPQPLILVGGGSVLIPNELEGVSEVIRPENYEIANAFGSSIAQVSGQVEKIFDLSKMTREEAIIEAKETAKQEAIKAGANPETVEVVEVEDVPLAYLPGNATRVRVKATGDLKG